ncbi:pseudouridine synthase [Oxalobacter formigenes]|uniref:RNA pseudouridine synthase n=2 Tax=Oxalobacter formigenes TaxID=847 RepID=C3XCW5_OXAFO|nr:pseudouridine synthase [Oxalobacter formigenes]ARQ47020.1 Ribosomal large subunit pseudouridine synthase A [Oxalobacter formigenes]ARQ79051.1 pseudouridine synthase [Oxalobacter formigenes OXCC13]EEO28974.1 RNA pseudouridine synthase [Oxalobacter formigenes OXCC13]MCZ4063784.1 pseudouridine synthase [Oxalobacter formigenes]QDX32355.1 pseudouridine synthase [Oxalobacter formigenes]
MNFSGRHLKKITIPSKNGITASQVSLPKGPWKTMEDFLSERFPVLTKEEWQKRVIAGDVLNENGTPLSSGAPYTPYQKLYYYRYLPNERPNPFQETVLYQDDWLVVADKPHFLPVTPSGKYVSETLLVRLRKKLGIDTLTPIHRIDRETAGLVLFSVKPEGRNLYQRLFRENFVSKHYEAIAPYRDDIAFPMRYRSRIEEGDSFMRMRVIPDGTPNAETEISIQQKSNAFAHYHLKPVTGRKHQLRIQMCSLGIPLLNDRIYPVHLPEAVTDEMQAEEFRYPLQLVAKSVSFKDPVSEKIHHFESRHCLDLNRISDFID